MMGKIPTSLFTRGSKLLGLASQIALQEVSERMKTWEDDKEKLKNKIELAQNVVKTLSQLKGASMKVGQLLSLDLGDYLPPEMTKILEQLHQKSVFLESGEIFNILKIELQDKFSHFSQISKTPLAAASIGQVHLAQLSGESVVIKIQYPGVADSIPSDLKILEIILKQGSFLFNKSQTDIKPLMEEFREVLLREVDYAQELQMQKLYREKFHGKDFYVPQVYEDYSTSKILTQEYVEGLSFSKWLEGNPAHDKKEKMAHLLMRLYLEELFQHGLVQTDPNPGNFIITSENKMCLLDFGAVKKYDEDFIKGYRGVLMAAYVGDTQQLLSLSYSLGFLDAREDEKVKTIYLEMMSFLITPFKSDELFDFTDRSFFEKARNLSWEMTKLSKFSPPPKDLIFLHRKLAGIFTFIKKMEVKLHLKEYWSYVIN